MSSAGWALDLRIRDTQGNPVAMAAVCITAGPSDVPDIAALSADDGGVSLSVPVAGDYEVLVRADGFAPVARSVAATNTRSTVDISLQ